jgi:16S rRNA processing protein RimM
LLELGRVAGTYGVRGWIRVAPHSGDPGGLLGHAVWSIGGAEHAVAQAKPYSGDVLAKLEGCDTREQARALQGAAVAVPRSGMPEAEPGSFYWDDLVGLEVVNRAGEPLGTVKRLFSNGAHDVMELAGRRARLVPWVPGVVTRVDLEARRIEVEWGADW